MPGGPAAYVYVYQLYSAHKPTRTLIKALFTTGDKTFWHTQRTSENNASQCFSK